MKKIDIMLFKTLKRCFETHSVHPSFLLGEGGGVEPPTKFQKGGTGQDLNFWRRVGGKERVTLLRGGGLQLLHKK